jgi:hypothetical protein
VSRHSEHSACSPEARGVTVLVNGNFRLANAFGRLPRKKGSGRLRRGDQVRRRQTRRGQAETGKVVQVNKVGVRRIHVHWTGGTYSNVKASSLKWIN